MKESIKTELSFSELVKRLEASEEFINSNSYDYNSRLRQRHAINEYFLSYSDEEVVISQNAGHGGITEIFAFLTQTDNKIEIKYNVGGFLPFNTFYILLLGLGVISILLILINVYFALAPVVLISLAFLIRVANRKSKRILVAKISKSINGK